MLYQRATAVLLPGVEDFGLVPVEAQACGTPVVALGRGGACESVLHGATGVLVPDESIDAFAAGLDAVRHLPADPAAIRAHALTFSRDVFQRGFRAVVHDALRPTLETAS
jgi:glycosyltransferase involved in cell wall biosynthesis